MKSKSISQIKLEITVQPNIYNIIFRMKCIGTAYKRGLGYDITWNNGEESNFDNIYELEEMGPIIAECQGYL